MLDSARDMEQRRKLAAAPQLAPEMRTAALAEASRRLGLGLLQPWLKAGIGFDEAFLLGMYAPDMAPENLASYVGKARQARFHTACNNAHWFAAADDKALYYTILKGAGFGVPETLAFVGPKPRAGMGEWLASEAALSGFLRANDDWPLFAKPVDGMFSLGCMKITGISADAVMLEGGFAASVGELWAYMQAMSKLGYLIQRCLKPSAFAARHFGQVIASARLLVLHSASEPKLESAVLKIPSGAHVADNFWRPGNMLASLDGQGHILRAITGKGLAERPAESHPATGAALAGLGLPDWQAMTALTLEAARLFPGIRTQSWDVALTQGGPHLLEVNFGGDLDLHQLAHRRGALTESYRAHLQACGVKLKGI